MFISLTLRIGEIYFHTNDTSLTLQKTQKEERLKWADQEYLTEASTLYLWSLRHPDKIEGAYFMAYEDLLYLSRHGKKPISQSPILGHRLKLYLGEKQQ